MYCENCGSKIPDGSAFCSNCGAKVEPGPPPANQPPVYPHSAEAYRGGNPAHPTGTYVAEDSGSQPPVYSQPAWQPPKKAANRQTGGIIGIIAGGVAVVVLFFLVIGPWIVQKTGAAATADSGAAANAQGKFLGKFSGDGGSLEFLSDRKIKVDLSDDATWIVLGNNNTTLKYRFIDKSFQTVPYDEATSMTLSLLDSNTFFTCPFVKVEKDMVIISPDTSRETIFYRDGGTSQSGTASNMEDQSSGPYQIGETVKTENLEITMTGIERATEWISGAEEGYEYVFVHFKIKNISNEKQSISDNDFQYKDEDGYSEGPVPHSTGIKTASGGEDDWPNSLAPGESCNASAVYEIPISMSQVIVEYIENMTYGSPRVQFSFDK